MSGVVAMPTRAGTRLLEGRQLQLQGGFDIDAFHVMEQRDNALIQDEILHGAMSRKFVYSFKIKETLVTGISVIGARQLAFHYQGLQHRIVASQEKTGTIFKFTSYPQPGMPMSVQASVLPELANEEDFYSAVVEVKDIKTGNTVQMESAETRMESRRDGSVYERPHFAKIAQAKAYRNAILALIPQDIQLKWKTQMLELGDGVVITEDVIEEKRAGVLRYAAQNAIPISRPALQAIGYDQITGLSDAARTGLPAFRAALSALGMADGGQPEPEPPPPARTASRPPRQPRQQHQASGPPADPPPHPGTDGPPEDPPERRHTGVYGSAGPVDPPATQDPPDPAPGPGAGEFQATLLDASGHALETHQDPVQWAHAFLGYRDRILPADFDSIDFHNHTAILDAAAASSEAAELLSAFLPPPVDVPIPLSSNIAVYGRAIQEAVAALTADTVLPFVAANQPNWATLPRSRQLELERMLVQRCQTLGVTPPRLFGSTQP
jgi:hypothetical protein